MFQNVVAKMYAFAGLMIMASSVLPQAMAAELNVNITGISDANGQIGCALFKGAEGFPMESTGARQLWLQPDIKGVTCSFGDVSAGTYAVAISHDLNGNKKTDTNFLGMPTEAWGVSNNVRPSLRAPRFEEAAFRIADGKSVTIEIKVAK